MQFVTLLSLWTWINILLRQNRATWIFKFISGYIFFFWGGGLLYYIYYIYVNWCYTGGQVSLILFSLCFTLYHKMKLDLVVILFNLYCKELPQSYASASAMKVEHLTSTFNETDEVRSFSIHLFRDGNAADAMFTVRAGCNSTFASVVWICLPAEAVAATYTGLSLISKNWSLCANPPSVLLIWASVLERSSKWSRDWPLLPLREEASSVGSEMSHWCLCLFRSQRAPLMEMESITGQQPCESTWGLLSWAH